MARALLAAHLLHLRRGMARWSSTKDPDLEVSLRRNRRWVVNNQIKRLLLRFPSRTAPVRFLQSHFKTLDLQGRAANWLRKYPCCFDLFPLGGGGDLHFGFTKRMAALVAAEEEAVAASEPAMASRLAKLLMLSRGRRLPVSKLAELRRPLGLPDDYLLRLLPSHPHLFRLSNPFPHRRSPSADLELLHWLPSLAISAVQSSSSPPRFACALPHSWIKSRAKFDEFNDANPYISPYAEHWDPAAAAASGAEAEKRAVGVVHELLSLTLWKKMSIVKLEHFRRELGLPEDTARMLLRHPCVFYVSNRYKVHTVVLREGYEGPELKEKDPVVVAKERLGELMQEGLHEYNQRRRAANLDRRRKRGEVEVKREEEEDEEEAAAVRLDTAEKREERRRFYKVLFDDNP